MSQSNIPNSQPRGWGQALGRAAESGDAARVRQLLGVGAPADARFEGGATALMRASARGYADVARVLLDAGASVNARRGDGFTPLVLAVFFGHEEVVRLLLERGADTSARTCLGVTARGWAAARGFAGIHGLLGSVPESPPRPREVSRPSEPVPDAGRPPAGSYPESYFVKREGPAAAPEWSATPAAASTAFAAAEAQTGAEPYHGGAVREPESDKPARGFLHSWKAAGGAVLLVAACGVAAFGVWQNGEDPTRGGGTPAPATAAPQAAQPLPSPAAGNLVAQPAPTPPASTDAPGGASMPDAPGASGVQPYPYEQPVVVPPDAANPPRGVWTSAATVVSESDAPATDATPRREARDARAVDATPDAPAGNLEEERRADEAGRRGRLPDAEAQAPPARRPASNLPPAPSATPRSRVIQWPP